MNAVTLVRPVLMVALWSCGAAIAGGLTTTNVFVFWAIALLAAVLLALLLLGLRNLHLPTIIWPRWPVLKAQVTFGLQGQAGNILQLLNYRLDKYVALAFVGTDGVGIYAVAVGVTESIWFISNAVAVVLLPRLTRASSEETAALTPLFCRHTIFLSLLGAVAVGALSPLLLPLMFGSDFSPAVTAVWWLLPGTVALAGTKVLAAYIFSRGKPLINTYITARAGWSSPCPPTSRSSPSSACPARRPPRRWPIALRSSSASPSIADSPDSRYGAPSPSTSPTCVSTQWWSDWFYPDAR